MDILQAARQLRPGTAWNLRAGVLEQVVDDAPRVEVPTLEELNAVMQPVAYRDQRASEYPPIADQLDALWKGGDAAAAMLAQVRAVKTKYPKPQ